MYSDYVYLYDRKSATVDGGSSTSGSWQTRDVTNEVEDAGSVCALSSNQFTLQAGTYRIFASSPILRSGESQARLWNITDGALELLGTSEENISGQTQGQTRSFVVGRFTIAGAKVFELQYRVTSSRADFGLGYSNTAGVDNIYTTIELWKET